MSSFAIVSKTVLKKRTMGNVNLKVLIAGWLEITIMSKHFKMRFTQFFNKTIDKYHKLKNRHFQCRYMELQETLLNCTY